MLHWLWPNCQSRFPCLPKTDSHFVQSETWMTRVSLRFWSSLVDYLQRLHSALAESCSVANLKVLRTFTVKKSRTSRRDSMLTWGGQTAWRTLKTALSQLLHVAQILVLACWLFKESACCIGLDRTAEADFHVCPKRILTSARAKLESKQD